MPTLTIKGIPDAVYKRLKRRASRHQRSLNREIIVCLERATVLPALDPESWLEEVDQLRERLSVTPLTERRLRRAKAAGRP